MLFPSTRAHCCIKKVVPLPDKLTSVPEIVLQYCKCYFEDGRYRSLHFKRGVT